MGRHLIRRLLLTYSCLLLVIGTAGCVGETISAAKWDGTVTHREGVAYVENFGAPLWTDQTRWTVSELFRIGTVEGDPHYQFGRLDGFKILSDGRIVVADGMGQHLKFFTSEGSYIKTVGKAGSGPKEFGGFMLLMRATGDTILVVDFQNMRVNCMSPEGEWLNSFPARPEGGWRIGNWDDSPSGRFVSLMTEMQSPESPRRDTMDLVVVRDTRGAFLDTLARIPASRGFQFSGGEPEWHFFFGVSEFDLTWDGGLVTARSDEYRLTWYDAEGNLARIVTLHRPRQPMVEADRHIKTAMIDSVLHARGGTPAQIAQMKSAVHFVEEYPAFRRFISGPNGTLWVQHLKPLRDLSDRERARQNPFSQWPPASPNWDVFDREGRYLGVVTFPDRFLIGDFWRDRVFGAWEDEFDVQYIMVMEIDGLPPPAEG